MKAIVCTKHGPPAGLELQEVEKPAPKDEEVLIRVRAATVTAGDVMLRKLPLLLWLPMRLLLGLRRRRIPGTEFAGEVVSVGRHVSRFRIGDRVFGTTTGLPAGAYAEFICVPEEREEGALAMQPANMSYEEAAAVPVGACTALYFLKRGNIDSGQQVVIYGASGSVGTFAVQLAKYFGAVVTGVCSRPNLELVTSLGADEVIDYTEEDFADRDIRYAMIFDAVGKKPLSACGNALTPSGTYVTVARGLARERSEDLAFLGGLIEAGKLRSVVDRRYPLEQAAEAHRYVERGHKRGNVVLSV